MAGPGPKCTAARLAVAWTVPAGSGPGPANAGVTTTRSVPDSAVTCSRHVRSGAMPWPLPSAAAAYVRSAHATGSPAYRASCVP